MFARTLTAIIFVVMAGCVGQSREPDTPVPAEPIVEVAPTEPAIVGPPEDLEDPVPDACELLLERLDTTHPLLDNLEAALAGQTARIEAAIERLEQPAAPPAQECPNIGDGELGSKDIIGAIEWLYMDPPGKHYRARVDSGAETSSLSASNVVEFERDSEDWVRFDIQLDPEEDPIDLELPIKRTVLIRQAPFVEPERRVVVEIDIRLGQELQSTEFTLTDRSRMTYPVLLGRAFLMDLYIVDVSRSFTHDRYEAP